MQPADRSVVLRHEGHARRYELHVPRGLPAEPSLLLVLHGGGGSGPWARTQTRFNAVSDREKFIVCYPWAHGLPTLAYWRTGAPEKFPTRINDLAFLMAVVADLDLPNPTKLFIAGISNGAHMALSLAAHWQRVRAVATVAAIRNPGQFMPLPGRPIPLIHFHGCHDRRWQPLFGGTSPADVFFQPYDIPPAPSAAALWAERNGCLPPFTTPRDIKDLRDHLQLEWPGAHPVRLLLLSDGGHSWPGGRISPREESEGCGPVSTFDASTEIWKFFKAC